MVTKTYTKTYCDDCEKENHIYLSIDNIDLCEGCTISRLNNDLKTNPIGTRICKNCKGTTQIKEYTGIGNDYNFVRCGCCRNGFVY